MKLSTYSDRLRGHIAAWEKRLAFCRKDRPTHTAKKLALANSMLLEAKQLRRQIGAALAILREIEEFGRDRLPDGFATNMVTREQFYELCRMKTERVSNGYHPYSVETRGYSDDSDEAVAWRKWIIDRQQLPKDAESAKDVNNSIRMMEARLQTMKIPGFFPTTESIADLMASRLKLPPNHSAAVDYCEIDPSLREILTAKGYGGPIGTDFLEFVKNAPYDYDRIIMNPPFEQLADIDHVRAAFDLLKPGGTLVALMSPGFAFRRDKKAEAFRDWLSSDAVEACERLDLGTPFKKGFIRTGVNIYMVVITKPGHSATAECMSVLEPSAGKGDLIDAVNRWVSGNSRSAEAATTVTPTPEAPTAEVVPGDVSTGISDEAKTVAVMDCQTANTELAAALSRFEAALNAVDTMGVS